MQYSAEYQLGELIGVLVVLAMVAADLVFFIIALIKALNTHRTGWIVAASISGLPVLLVVVLFLIGFVAGFREGLSHSQETGDTDKPVAARHSEPATVATATPATPTNGGVFIPAMNRVDMVADPKRNLLYISSGDSVLQYQLDSKKFLPPLVLGGDLRGIDISPDDKLLAVADAIGGNGRVCIHLVDLQTGKDSPVSFTATLQESGTFSVAFGADGQLWISSSLNGSGFLPMRKYNPATHGFQKLQDVAQDTMLSASADRQAIAFAEAGVSPGSYGRILYRASQLPRPMTADGYLYEIGISRDGAQLAVPRYDGVLLQGSATPKLDEDRILDVAYHPQKDYLFLTQAGTSLVSVYDTTTMARVKELDFGDQFDWIGNHAYQTGRLKLSPDGKYVFCTVTGGIRYAETGL